MIPSTSSATLSTHSISTSQSSSHGNTATVSTSGLVTKKLSSVTPDHACIEKQDHLNQSKDDIDKLTQSGECEKPSFGERVGREIDRFVPKVKRETERVEQQVERGTERIKQQAKNEFKRWFK